MDAIGDKSGNGQDLGQRTDEWEIPGNMAPPKKGLADVENQYEMHVEGCRWIEGERKLLAAILERTRWDLALKEFRDESIEWIRDGGDEKMSFVWICQQLDLPLDLMLSKMNKAIEETEAYVRETYRKRPTHHRRASQRRYRSRRAMLGDAGVSKGTGREDSFNEHPERCGILDGEYAAA